MSARESRGRETQRRTSREVGVDNCDTGESVEGGEGDDLGESDVAEDGSESGDAERRRADRPGESRVEEDVRGELGEGVEVGDREERVGLVVGDSDSSSRTDGREVDVGDVLALPVDHDSSGEGDEGVEGTSVEESSGERRGESSVGDVRDDTLGEGERGSVDNVRNH